MHYEMNAAQSFGVCEIILKNQFYVGKTFRFITVSWRNSCLNLQWYRFLWAFRELNVSSLSPWKIQYYKKMRKFFGQDILLSWMTSLHSFVICVSWTWEYIETLLDLQEQISHKSSYSRYRGTVLAKSHTVDQLQNGLKKSHDSYCQHYSVLPMLSAKS